MDSVSKHSSLLESDLDEKRLSPILAENVKRLRLQAKINKKTFSLMVGVGRPFLNKVECGVANPRLSVIVKIADALETTPEYLLTPHEENSDHTPAANRPSPGRTGEARHARLL